MESSQIFIDILRAAHLLCFAAGMGTALYFDFRSFQTLSKPILQNEVQGLIRIHIWITSAFACMWITGIILIYIRTSFNISAFSPKLWMKIGIMALMVWNAHKIGKTIIPLLQSNVGKPLIQFPVRKLTSATQLAINSMFCWTAGLLLGSSLVLKTAPWEVLLPLAIGWLFALTLIGQMTVYFVRSKARKKYSFLNAREVAGNSQFL